MSAETENAPELSRDLALRIGLAARELPDTDARRLLDVLIDCVGLPLSEAKFEGLKIKDLKQALDGELAELPKPALEAALRQLKGDQTDDSETAPGLPAVQGYREGDMPDSIRVACASNNGLDLDGHFGSCARFMVYQVSEHEARLIDIRESADAPPADDKNSARAALIRDCHLLYVASIGGPAAAKVVKADIHPIKQPQVGPIGEALDNLRQVLAGSPPPWLAKVMGRAASERVRFELSEAEDA